MLDGSVVLLFSLVRSLYSGDEEGGSCCFEVIDLGGEIFLCRVESESE